MEKNAKVYVAGHRGLVGSALVSRLRAEGFGNFLLKTHQELDLREQKAVNDFFAAEKPEYVFLAAAKVGGIGANNTYPADFIYNNLAIQNNVIHASYIYNVRKLLFLGSACIYPKVCQLPIKEEYLLSGPLEPTNEPYAVAKIAGLKMCQSYNRQYGANFIAVMPANLYGPGDNFDLQNSHVIPALLRKFHEAKTSGEKKVTLWGTGAPWREFLHADDMADGCIFLMEHFNPTKEQNERGEIFANLGMGQDITIKDLAELIQKITGYEGKIEWDPAKPDGVFRRTLDISRIRALGWRHKIELDQGLKTTYDWYQSNCNLK
ncbi:GDP-L-fucose synthase [Patescibacteria group bacterium]|nr:MAG: GDP-L-fucose synthase [Patescibacteria group bacterium]